MRNILIAFRHWQCSSLVYVLDAGDVMMVMHINAADEPVGIWMEDQRNECWLEC